MKKTFLIFLLIGFLVSCKEETAKHESIDTKEIKFTKNGELTFFDESGEVLKELEIETAISDYEQQTGLMYRKSMAENRGMLFVYKNEQPRPYFYMKNTYIALDLIYISADEKVVDIKKNAQPHDESLIRSEVPAQYVLEINGGMADQWGLKIGDQVSFDLQ